MTAVRYFVISLHLFITYRNIIILFQSRTVQNLYPAKDDSRNVQVYSNQYIYLMKIHLISCMHLFTHRVLTDLCTSSNVFACMVGLLGERYANAQFELSMNFDAAGLSGLRRTVSGRLYLTFAYYSDNRNLYLCITKQFLNYFD